MSAWILLSKSFVLAISSAAFLTIGCADPLKVESLIQETRVLGARVQVTGNPLVGSPAPGEHAHMDVFVAAPNGAPNVAYAFSLCGVMPSNTGFPSCVSAPFATAFQAAPELADPQLDFEVPTDLDVGATPHGFASGIVCPDGAAELTLDGGARCVSGPGDEVAFEFDFAGPGEDNDNPTFNADSLTLDGAIWAASDLSATCPGTLLDVHAESKHTFGVQLQDSDFDSLTPISPEDPTRETLLVSQFCDTGTLAHTFDSFSVDTPSLQSSVEWDAPTKTAGSGTVVRFYFVVRDSRGGEDFATRALCLVP